jgi:hypothetical protein
MFVAIDPEALAGGTVYAERIETLVAAMLAEEQPCFMLWYGALDSNACWSAPWH